MFTKFYIIIEDFAERHYIKKFSKKYKKEWSPVWIGIQESLKRFDQLYLKKRVVLVAGTQQFGVFKMDFKVTATESARKAGNRCIVLLDRDRNAVNVLLVYHKDHLGKGNETSEWKNLIQKNYPKDMLKDLRL